MDRGTVATEAHSFSPSVNPGKLSVASDIYEQYFVYSS